MNDSGRNRRSLITAATLFALAGGMVGLAFASVPLYRLFCQVTGFGGTPRIDTAAAAAEGTSSRVITVRFDGTVNSALPWRFTPDQRALRVHPGESTLATFTARNLGATAVTGTATYNVTPNKAAPYFVKVQCFCFTRQVLAPGQEVPMPVSFFVDPEILNDPATRDVTTITLSYTFFPADENGDAIGAPDESGTS